MDIEAYRKILSLAITREVDSYTFYRGVADKVNDPNLKKLFLELAGDETKHRGILTGFLAKPPKSLKFDASRDYKVAESLKTPDLSPNLKPIEGIIIAIRKELEAMQIYTQLASHSTMQTRRRCSQNLRRWNVAIRHD